MNVRQTVYMVECISPLGSVVDVMWSGAKLTNLDTGETLYDTATMTTEECNQVAERMRPQVKGFEMRSEVVAQQPVEWGESP